MVRKRRVKSGRGSKTIKRLATSNRSRKKRCRWAWCRRAMRSVRRWRSATRRLRSSSVGGGASKTIESAEALVRQVEELRAASDEQRVGFELRLAGARSVTRCDRDNAWDADKMEIALSETKAHEADARPALVCTDLRVVDEKLNLISASFFRYSHIDTSNLTSFLSLPQAWQRAAR